MYEILTKEKEPLIKENCFYIGDTSEIYRVDDILYKVYLKKEPFKRHILDYLIEHYDELRPYSIPPLGKLKIDDKYGMKMRYVDSIDFLTYLRTEKVTPAEMARIIKILSDNLKPINDLDIHFSDLHHHNILLRQKDLYPLYIDLDDAVVKDYGSTHICVMSHRLHNVEKKSYEYEDDLIRYGNLDQECLTLMLLNYIMNKPMERLSYDDFHREIEKISPYFSQKLIQAMIDLKDKDASTIITPYKHYIGDYIETDCFVESMQKVKRRVFNENGSISSNK